MSGSGLSEEVHGTSVEGSGNSSDLEPEWGSEQEERDSSSDQDLNSSRVEESDRGSDISSDSSEHIFVRMARHLEEQVSGHNLDTCIGGQANFLCQLPLDILTLVASFADTVGNCKDLCQTCSLFRQYRVLAASFAVMHDREIVAVNKVFREIVYYSGVVTGCTHIKIHTKEMFRFLAPAYGDYIGNHPGVTDVEEYALNLGRSGLALTSKVNVEVRDWIVSRHSIDLEQNLTGEARRLFFWAQRQEWDCGDGCVVILYRQVGLDAVNPDPVSVYVLEGWWCTVPGIATRHLQWRVTVKYSPNLSERHHGVMHIEVMDIGLSKDILNHVGFVTSEILTSGGAYRVDVQSQLDAAGRARDFVWASYNLFAKGLVDGTGVHFSRRVWGEDDGYIEQSRAHHLALPSYFCRYRFYPQVWIQFWLRSEMPASHWG